MSVLEDIRASRATGLGFAAMGFVWASFSAQVPDLKAQIGASDAVFGATFLISSLGAMGAMWLAPLMDRAIGAFSLMAASAAMALAFLIPSVAGSVALFTFGMLLTAAASGISDILMNARLAEIEARRRRPLMNLNHAIYSFSYAGAALLVGAAREAGWPPLTVFSVVCGVVLLMCIAMRAPHQRVAGEASVLPPATAEAVVWLAGIIFLVGFLTEQAIEGWSALHLERTLGGSPAEGAMGPALLGLTMGIGRLCGQAVASRVRDTLLIGLACLVAASGVALAALAPNLGLAYVGFGIMGTGISVVIPLSMALLGRAVPEDARVKAIGRASVVGYGAFLVGPSLIGLTSDAFGLRAAFLLVSLLLVAVAALVVPLIGRRVALVR